MSYLAKLTKIDGENRFLIKYNFMCKFVINETAPNRDVFRLGNTHSLILVINQLNAQNLVL